VRPDDTRGAHQCDFCTFRKSNLLQVIFSTELDDTLEGGNSAYAAAPERSSMDQYSLVRDLLAGEVAQ
jgi:hypothetical protein